MIFVMRLADNVHGGLFEYFFQFYLRTSTYRQSCLVVWFSYCDTRPGFHGFFFLIADVVVRQAQHLKYILSLDVIVYWRVQTTFFLSQMLLSVRHSIWTIPRPWVSVPVWLKIVRHTQLEFQRKLLASHTPERTTVVHVSWHGPRTSVMRCFLSVNSKRTISTGWPWGTSDWSHPFHTNPQNWLIVSPWRFMQPLLFRIVWQPAMRCNCCGICFQWNW